MILATQEDDPPMIDLSPAIRRELQAAHAKWGDTFELQMLEQSWGDTLDDEEMLAALGHFQKLGKYLDSFLAVTAPIRPAS
jgi:hypothetical protein